MIEAIIGVAGTVIGTILGWVLARLNTGRLYVSLADYDIQCYRTDDLTHISGKAKHELYGVRFQFTIRLYNSFQINRAIRDCELVFIDRQGAEIGTDKVKDYSTGHSFGGGVRYDELSVVNIPGYESKDINAITYVSDIDMLYRTGRIEFRYKTDKLKTKKLDYKQYDFTTIPRISEGGSSNG